MRDDQLDRLLEKLEKIDDRIGSIDITLAKQEVSLADHIRRTELAEAAIANMEADLKPLNRHVDMIQGALKFISILATLAGLIAGVIKLLGH